MMLGDGGIINRYRIWWTGIWSAVVKRKVNKHHNTLYHINYLYPSSGVSGEFSFWSDLVGVVSVLCAGNYPSSKDISYASPSIFGPHILAIVPWEYKRLLLYFATTSVPMRIDASLLALKTISSLWRISPTKLRISWSQRTKILSPSRSDLLINSGRLFAFGYFGEAKKASQVEGNSSVPSLSFSHFEVAL